MKFWKISLGTSFFSKETCELMKQMGVISLHPDTAAKGVSSKTQGEDFVNAKAYDLFYVCRSNETIEFIGMFIDKRPLYSIVKGHDDWVDREFVLIKDALKPGSYNKGFDRWWSPKNNSTFIEINPAQYNEFEKDFLMPVFEVSLNEIKNIRTKMKEKYSLNMPKISELQKYFHELTNKTKLFSELNQISEIELKKLEYEYALKGEGVLKQPVVLLRKKIIESLLLSQAIDDQKIKDLKQGIADQFEKNVFKSWTDPYRIIYPLFFTRHKIDLEVYMKRLIGLIKRKLNIETIASQTLIHFDGPQNQGSDEIWFAIFNNTYKSQKHAYQLFFKLFDKGFQYGLLHMDNAVQNQLVTKDVLRWKDLIEEYKKHLDTIQKDNSKTKAMISNLIELFNIKGQIILQGPPGTGKTYTAKDIAEMIIFNDISSDKSIQKVNLEKSNRFKLIQFHPAFTYEDFVRGIIAQPKGDDIEYKVVNRVLAEFSETAMKSKEKFVLIIDEINRANLPSVLGELIYALEYRGESVEGMYELNGDRKIMLPINLLIIGTMNTADRSVGHIDYAIRRRFAFVDILPSIEPVHALAQSLFRQVSELFIQNYDSIDWKNPILKRSDFLASDFRPEDVWIGHSYFISDKETDDEAKQQLQIKLEYEIKPLLKEYMKDGLLLPAAEQKINELHV